MLQRQIELIKNRELLTGTDYFEFQPRIYADQCWKDDSVFMDEEVFTLIEPIFKKNISDYDHYAFMVVCAKTWKSIISDLDETKMRLETITPKEIDKLLGMMFTTTKENFNSDFIENVNRTKLLINDLQEWLTAELLNHQNISILGM